MQISWWQKIVSIPLIVIVYLFAIDLLSSNNIFISSVSGSEDMGNALNIGLGQAVGVSVTREYFGGAMRLPIYSGAIGDIGIYHNIFFNYFIYIYAAAMIFWTAMDFGIFGKKQKGKKLINRRAKRKGR